MALRIKLNGEYSERVVARETNHLWTLKKESRDKPKQPEYMPTVVAYGRISLNEIIRDTIERYGNKCDLNFIDVRHITDMRNLFSKSDFNGDISKWNVSKVEDMDGMFEGSNFNGDISQWDVSNVEYMSRMFASSSFNGDISKWDVSNVVDMHNMFEHTHFNGDISKWNVSNVQDMSSMFRLSDYKQSWIQSWKISPDCNTNGMFAKY